MMNRLLPVIIISSAISACTTYTINPGSERLRVFENEPKGCIYVGELSSVQEDELRPKDPQPEMALATRVDLRNTAHKLGGNVLVFMKTADGKNKVAASTAPSAPGKLSSVAPPTAPIEDDDSPRKRLTTFLATTFRCPASIVNQ